MKKTMQWIRKWKKGNGRGRKNKIEKLRGKAKDILASE